MNITLNHTISVKDYNMLRKAVNWLTLEEEARQGAELIILIIQCVP